MIQQEWYRNYYIYRPYKKLPGIIINYDTQIIKDTVNYQDMLLHWSSCGVVLC